MKADYYQDDTGQWWYKRPIRGNRFRVFPQICQQCGETFINRHTQTFCSRKCLGIASRGNRKGERPCGWCGKMFTPPARKNRQKCCSKRCAYDLGNSKRGRPGESNPNWKGGIRQGPAGYIREYIQGRGHLLQHRLVMERALGRQLLRGEIVHHKNGNKKDNRLANLELCLKNHHPPSQKVSDLLIYSHWIIDNYGKLENK